MECGIDLVDELVAIHYDAVFPAGAHRQIRTLALQVCFVLGEASGVLYEITLVFTRNAVDGRLYDVFEV
jgi:hypothetical protein